MRGEPAAERERETVNSDTLALQKQPFSCPSSYQLCYREEKKREEDGGEGKEKKSQKDLFHSCSLSVSLSRSVLFPCS